MRRWLLVGLALAACSSGHHTATPKVTEKATATAVAAPGITAARLEGGQLVVTASGRRLSAPAESSTGKPVVTRRHDGVLVEVGQGASTTLYGLWAVDGDRLVRVPAPAGEPGAGLAWRISVGAGAVMSSGLRCTAGGLDILESVNGTITLRSYEIQAGQVVTGVPGDAPPADQVGSLDC